MSISVDQLVAASGLSPLFAKSAIQRAVDRCGVRLDRLDAGDAERLAEDLGRVVAIFDPDGVDRAMRRIRETLALS